MSRICALAFVAGLITLLSNSISGGFAQERSASVNQIPDLSGFWQHTPLSIFQDVPQKAPPIHDFKGTPPQTRVGTGWMLEGDYTVPLLKPWAATELKRHADAAHVQRPLPTPQEVCEPSGVPNVLTLPAPVQILQQPDKVTFVYQRDHQVRTIYLNRMHDSRLRPSWYGESVGHYEGDTLVIDTVGMNDKTPVDFFGTPHSDALHVVERYRPINNRRQIEVTFTVDDPNAFTAEWAGRILYDRVNTEALEEEVCSEFNLDVLSGRFYPIPEAARPDF